MKKPAIPSALIFFLLLAVGCATKPPKRQTQAPLNVPPAWMAAAPAGQLDESWWQAFNATGLVAAVREALTNNFDLRAAAARLEAAIAQARLAGADLQPKAGFDLSGQRQQRNFIGLPIPGAGSKVLSSRSTTFGANFSASWELDVWGRIRAGHRAALADAQAAEDELAFARLSLAAQTIKAWLAQVEARQQLDLAEERVRSHEATAAQTRRRYEQGLKSPLDARLALSGLAAAKAALAERRQLLERATRQVEILAGRYPRGAGVEGDRLPELPPPPPAGLPSELLERRPDLRAAERRLAAADQRLLQSRAALYPRFSLTASGGTSTKDLEDLVASEFKVWTIAANAVQPLFEGGKLRAGVAQAKARAEQALAEYGRAVLNAFGEVENQLAAAAPLADREAELEESLRQARAALAQAESRYGAGLEDFLTVLISQRQVFDLQSQWLAVRRLRLDNRVDLHLALGGGFAPAAGATPKKAAGGPEAGGHAPPKDKS